MLIRIFLFFVITVIIYSTAHADAGSFLSMKATITLTDGTLRNGYFSLATYDLYVAKEGDGYFYTIFGKRMHLRSLVGSPEYVIDIVKTDYHFSNAVKSILNDSIVLYDNVVIVNNQQKEKKWTVLFCEVGPSEKISIDSVQDIVVHRVYTMAPNNATPLIKEDLQWIKSVKIVDVVSFGSDYCTYEAFFFEHNKRKVKELIDQLIDLYRKGDFISDKSEGQKNKKQIDKALEILKKEKVIITSFCSC